MTRFDTPDCVIPNGQQRTDARPAVADLQRLAAAVDAARAAGREPAAAEIAEAAGVDRVLAAAFLRWQASQRVQPDDHRTCIVLLTTAEFTAIPNPATAEGNQTMSTDKKTQTNLPSIKDSAAAVRAAATSGDTPAPAERSPRGRRRGEFAVLLDPVQKAIDELVAAEQKKERLAPHHAALNAAVDAFNREYTKRVEAARRAAALLG